MLTTVGRNGGPGRLRWGWFVFIIVVYHVIIKIYYVCVCVCNVYVLLCKMSDAVGQRVYIYTPLAATGIPF